MLPSIRKIKLIQSEGKNIASVGWKTTSPCHGSMGVGEALEKTWAQTGNGAKGTSRGFICSRYLPIVSQRPLK